jgi:hypothetical protein
MLAFAGTFIPLVVLSEISCQAIGSGACDFWERIAFTVLKVGGSPN